MPISITRTYDSRAALAGLKGDFGLGWSLSTSDITLQKNGPVGAGKSGEEVWSQTKSGAFTTYRVQPTKPRIITITMPGGSVYSFRVRLNPSQQFAYPIEGGEVEWVAQSGTKGTLTATDGSTMFLSQVNGPLFLQDENGDPYDEHQFTLTLPNGTRMELAEKGYGANPKQSLQSIRDLNGNVMRFGANGITSTPASGAAKGVQFVRDSRGYITSIADLKGNRVLYDTDSNGDLASFTDRESNATTFSYGINADGTQAPPHYLTQLHNARGKTPLANHYDAAGRLDYSYVLNDPSKKIAYTHDLANRAEIIDNLGRKSSSRYDSYGNVTSQTKYLDNGDGTTRAITTTTEYKDAVSPELPTKMTDELGRVTSMTYDVWGNVTTVTPPLGQQIETSYVYSKDAIPSVVETWTRQLVNGVWTRVQRQSRQEYNAKGQPVASYDISNLKTSIEYSNVGVPTKVTRVADGQSYVTTSTVDSTTGNVLSTTDAAGQSTFFQYDANNQRTATRSTRTKADGSKEDVVSKQILDGEGRTIRSERGVAAVGSWNANVLQASETKYRR